MLGKKQSIRHWKPTYVSSALSWWRCQYMYVGPLKAASGHAELPECIGNPFWIK